MANWHAHRERCRRLAEQHAAKQLRLQPRKRRARAPKARQAAQQQVPAPCPHCGHARTCGAGGGCKLPIGGGGSATAWWPSPAARGLAAADRFTAAAAAAAVWPPAAGPQDAGRGSPKGAATGLPAPAFEPDGPALSEIIEASPQQLIALLDRVSGRLRGHVRACASAGIAPAVALAVPVPALSAGGGAACSAQTLLRVRRMILAELERRRAALLTQQGAIAAALETACEPCCGPAGGAATCVDPACARCAPGAADAAGAALEAALLDAGAPGAIAPQASGASMLAVWGGIQAAAGGGGASGGCPAQPALHQLSSMRSSTLDADLCGFAPACDAPPRPPACESVTEGAVPRHSSPHLDQASPLGAAPPAAAPHMAPLLGGGGGLGSELDALAAGGGEGDMFTDVDLFLEDLLPLEGLDEDGTLAVMGSGAGGAAAGGGCPAAGAPDAAQLSAATADSSGSGGSAAAAAALAPPAAAPPPASPVPAAALAPLRAASGYAAAADAAQAAARAATAAGAGLSLLQQLGALLAKHAREAADAEAELSKQAAALERAVAAVEVGGRVAAA
jgi:hypothetical protein